jgi:hypothetical protein
MSANVGEDRPACAVSAADEHAVGGPVPKGWREGVLTRAKEIESLCCWVMVNGHREHADVLAKDVMCHITAARQAATAVSLDSNKLLHPFRNGPLLERAMSNLDAAEAQILNFASAEHILGLFPSLLRRVQCHLEQTDPRRQEFERLARRLGFTETDLPTSPPGDEEFDEQKKLVDRERGKIAATTRAASSAALREQVRVRSFRTVLVGTAIVMMLIAIGIALIGFLDKTLIPLCFAPEEAGRAMVVCPTGQSDSYPVRPDSSTTPQEPIPDIDDKIDATAHKPDLLVVEVVGLAAAAVASAAAIRRIRGSSERYGIPVALAALKLPTGAITAVLGILLMRGNFVPGLSALDTSAQILAWALVFGYAQQLFTRFVDRQGQTILDSVRNIDKPGAQL